MIEGTIAGLIVGIIIGAIECALVVFIGWAVFAILGACNVAYDAEGIRHIVHIIGYVVGGVNVIGCTFVGTFAE